mmetsp:Transcript_65695/g.109488  ORF Transcript_65695/g.109488 Transcript_65695/m.109488 type:complete len:263 (+) Transcript_65695:1148-1936(+)
MVLCGEWRVITILIVEVPADVDEFEALALLRLHLLGDGGDRFVGAVSGVPVAENQSHVVVFAQQLGQRHGTAPRRGEGEGRAAAVDLPEARSGLCGSLLLQRAHALGGEGKGGRAVLGNERVQVHLLVPVEPLACRVQSHQRRDSGDAERFPEAFAQRLVLERDCGPRHLGAVLVEARLVRVPRHEHHLCLRGIACRPLVLRVGLGELRGEAPAGRAPMGGEVQADGLLGAREGGRVQLFARTCDQLRPKQRLERHLGPGHA